MRSFEVNPTHLMHEVYSYPFPEVRDTIDRLRLEARFMLNTINVDEAASLLEPYQFTPPLALPASADGALNLDELHVPVIERIREKQALVISGLEDFTHTYPTPGSSHALFTVMAEWRAQGNLESVAVIDGDYEGYTAYAESLRIPVTRYQNFEGTAPKNGEVWFVSNPSAVDGNWIDEPRWREFTEAGHQIVYDAAYAGLTPGGAVDVSSPHIKAVLTSPSKLFGVFRYRNTGVAYTREPVSALYGTKWFKDVPALLDTLTLYEQFGNNELPQKYRARQEHICAALSELVGAQIDASDVLLLGHTSQRLPEAYHRFLRAGDYRFGLTKLFEDYEKTAV